MVRKNCISRPARSILIFLAFLLFTILVRLQTFGNPVLGFDEQFYLLVGDRMLHGAVPYIDIFDRKPIGLFLIYAAIRKIGGEGFIQYQLVAAGFTAATAFLIYRIARELGKGFAPGIAACLYILWLCLMECEGGQAPVFYNLPMAMAALLTLRAMTTERRVVSLGCAAMLLVGIAMQIKYTSLFEGVFFGTTLLWTRFRSNSQLLPAATVSLLWIGCALLPTAAAMFFYWHIGALRPFFFANFLSFFGRLSDPLTAQIAGLTILVGILSPLVFFAVLGPRVRSKQTAFIWLWLGACLFGVFAVGSFLNPHYGAPVLLPLTIATVPCFSSNSRRQMMGIALAAVAVVAGQLVMSVLIAWKGGRSEAMAVAEAARPQHGCIYVYDGYPALYFLTKSCLLTRWIFPGHLNTQDEASIKALGVDPVSEERRILQGRPDVIVDVQPVYGLGNPQTHALVQAALARDYHLTAKIRTGAAIYHLVYRRN